MDDHALNLLEFHRIKNNLKEFAFSPGGQRLIQNQAILTDGQKISSLHLKVDAVKKILESGTNFPSLDFPDITGSLKHMCIREAFLEPEEFHSLFRYFGASIQLKKFLKANAAEQTLLDDTAAIPELNELQSAISRVIDRDGKVRDSKIPELAGLRKKITRLKTDIEKQVQSYINNPDYRNYLQSTLPTLKDGRSVLAVKANHRGKIKGIVHEVSSSGSTVYIEPAHAVEMNNEIVRLENEYRQELVKILKGLTVRMAERADDIRRMEETVSLLDSYYSRARYAVATNAVMPENLPSLHLINARHLFIKPPVVPMTIDLKEGIRVLIITGPNTGGKTVSLKTAGLIALMNQFGMQIPCDPGSGLPVFDNIFADIGDEQSIEQCLSTFSGHIRNMSRIISKSTYKSLVLLDELGSGTDPEEGVAIAMAVLDHFIEKKCHVLTSTHHGILKNYGYTKTAAVNACMEFDPEKLTPTFRVIMGIPGESYALPIAERHGIPETVIHKAKEYLNDERTDISGLIKSLSEKHRELLEEEERQKLLDRELTEKLRHSDLKELQLKQKEIELREKGLSELKSFLSRSRKELENKIREIREGELTKEKIRNVKDFLYSIEEKVNDEDEKIKRHINEMDTGPDYYLEPGMKVRIRSTQRNGIILRKGRKKSWIVETDTLKAEFNEKDLEPQEPPESESTVEIYSAGLNNDSTVGIQLDVRGERLEEAVKKLEKQIDGALLRGLREFSVVHGKGEGVLQHGIHEYLKKCRYVKDYFFSTPEEGGFGKTIVILKD
ncbi:MAG: endonuclease MutS2 [Spirochaetales bacterium]|nr:endonuclease MutS2 [Spirochaetales bacterium]